MEPNGAAYILTAAQFAGEVNQRGGNVAVRQAQVERVLSSFEESKKHMSMDGIEETHKYLRTGQWVQDYTSAGSHQAYKRFVGTGGYRKHYKPFYPRLADSDKARRFIMGDYRWRDFQVGRQASNNTIHVTISKAKGHAAALNDDSNTNKKQKALDGYLRAAAQLSAELNTESQLKGRDREVQVLQDQLRDSQQRNADLERQLHEQTQLRRHAEHQTQVSQNRLKERQEQLQDAQDQLQDTQRQLEDSRLYAKGLEDKQDQTKAHVTRHQQIFMETIELDKQREIKSAMRQQCINSIAKQSFSRPEGVKAANKRPAPGITDSKEPKRPRQN
ncbi:hypothetical protein Forpe1208_v007116 [Fusarium oxysporum f. sp. rapae]|uniref:Uncharacterized protein n=1 Tax=Fusarium oxysporum f. sp. rapae TaxID=485398 RepID=A0A8J5TUU2_FUSOX|nr:hypothetical protein Forpe1208_v007116 [Fusarium oxysporum f. sp. rapae]